MRQVTAISNRSALSGNPIVGNLKVRLRWSDLQLAILHAVANISTGRNGIIMCDHQNGQSVKLIEFG